MNYLVLYSIEGVVDWMPFSSEEAFDKYLAGLSKEDRKLFCVLERGYENNLSVQHCQEMKRRTPLVCRIGKAFATSDEEEISRLREQHPCSFVEG